MNGFGRTIWQDGNVYIGWWREGKACGYGRRIYPEGTIKEGYFQNHKFVGKPGDKATRIVFDFESERTIPFNADDYTLPPSK